MASATAASASACGTGRTRTTAKPNSWKEARPNFSSIRPATASRELATVWPLAAGMHPRVEPAMRPKMHVLSGALAAQPS